MFRGRIRPVLYLPGILAAGVVAALLFVPGDEKPGRPAPDFSLESVDRSGPGLHSAHLDGKPVVLNFFASWCVPCRREMPLLQAEHLRSGDEIAFVGIDHRDSRTHAADLLKEAGVTYPTGYDPTGSVATRYRLRRGLPVTVFIGSNGRVVGEKVGELSGEELRQWVERLTANT